jgi:glycosyltransferase involved in cell wall biosynthesis
VASELQKMTDAAITPPSRSHEPRLLVVDLYAGGHHGLYLESLRAAWAGRTGGTMRVVVSREYESVHPELLECLQRTRSTELHLVPGPTLDGSTRALIRADIRHGTVVAEQAASFGATHALLLYFDHVQLSLASILRLRLGRRVHVAGICFKPTFHYASSRLSGRGGLSAIRKRLVLTAALSNPRVTTVFCLDPLAAAWLEQHTRVRGVALPEPFVHDNDVADPPRSGNGERRRLLVLGNIDRRKGIEQVVAALRLLPPALQSQLEFVVAGAFADADRGRFLDGLARLRDETPIAVLVHDRFLAEDELQPLVRAADLVLLAYDGHVGSSGILVRAAAAGVPVLATAEGLLGNLVAAHGLGATVEASSPRAIAQALTSWCERPEDVGFRASGAAAFAERNSAAAFSSTIFDAILHREAR